MGFIKHYSIVFFMENACTQPTEKEILDIIVRLCPDRNQLNENVILAALMREFKGRVNPELVRQVIKGLLQKNLGSLDASTLN
jgi:hypothetical protein